MKLISRPTSDKFHASECKASNERGSRLLSAKVRGSERRLNASLHLWRVPALILFCGLGLSTSKLCAVQDPAPADKSAASSPNVPQQDQRPPAPQNQKATEQKSTEQKPTDQKPGDQKPAHQKPPEQKPAEEKPGEQKPGNQPTPAQPQLQLEAPQVAPATPLST